MRKSILIAHPDSGIRKILSHIIKTSCHSVFEDRGWQDLPIKEASSLGDALLSKEPYEILIAHVNGVDPNAEDVANIRQIRFNGVYSPVIALSFTNRNVHRVFHEKAHALLIYPFKLSALRDILKNIIPIEAKALKGLRERVFSDPEYLKTLLGLIQHAVGHKKWDQIKLYISQIEECFGNKITSDELVKLLERKECNISDWQEKIDGIWREYYAL